MINRKPCFIAILALAVASSMTGTAWAQLTVDGIVGVACTDDDIAEGNFLGSDASAIDFFRESSGSSVDCWKHAHPNGTDVIFIPGSWGRTPAYAAGATRTIRGAYEAILETRDMVETLDGPLEMPITVFILFDLFPDDPLPSYHDASGLSGPRPNKNGNCLVMYRGREKFGITDLASDPFDLYKMILAHEIGHCYEVEKLSTDGDFWVKESFANFVAVNVYPSANGEHRHLRGTDTTPGYNLFTNDFRQPYGAFILFEYIQTHHGLAQAWGVIRQLNQTNDRGDQYRIIGENVDFHGFLNAYMDEGIPDPGLCDGAPCNYPKANDLIESPSFQERFDRFRPLVSPNRHNLGRNEFLMPALEPGRYIPFGLSVLSHRHSTIESVQSAESTLDATLYYSVGSRLHADVILRPGRVGEGPVTERADCIVNTALRGFFSHLNPEPITDAVLVLRLEENPACRCLPFAETNRDCRL